MISYSYPGVFSSADSGLESTKYVSLTLDGKLFPVETIAFLLDFELLRKLLMRVDG